MKKIAIFSLILASIGGISGCQKAPESQDPVIRPAKIMTITQASDGRFRSFPAMVEANQGANLAFRVSGEIQAFLVKPGETVVQGQVLAKLDPEDFQLRLNDRAARYELADSQYTRAVSLRERDMMSQAQLDEARANLLIAEAELKKAQTDLQYTQLRAPYEGVISTVYVKNRENIQAQQNILRVLNNDLLDVSIQVPERIFARVDRGQKYRPEVSFDARPDKRYLLDIKEWDTQADPVTLTYRVVFSLPTPEDLNVLPGMTAEVHADMNKIMEGADTTIVIPIGAVFSPDNEEDGQAFVWRFNSDEQTVHLTPVKIGQVKNTGIEILDGLNNGDQIVTAGVHHLKEGMQVRLWTKERGI